MTTDESLAKDTVLVIIDVQNELVADQRLIPSANQFVFNVDTLLKAFRSLQIAIIHVHYVTEPDGRGYMAHHKSKNQQRCVRGTSGAAPHPVAEPLENEPVITKYSYSAFSSPEFETQLLHNGADNLVICGLYSHACVYQTALDALARNFRVFIAAEAVASYDPLHADVARNFLTDRGVNYLDTQTLITRLSRATQPSQNVSSDQTHPVACIDGHWLPGSDQKLIELRNPSRWQQVLGYQYVADAAVVDKAVTNAALAQQDWKTKLLEDRIAAVEKWATILESRSDRFIAHMIDEVGKPISNCRGEMDFLSQSLRVLVKCVCDEPHGKVFDDHGGQFASARRYPRGVVAIISPWNNPVFLPANKIAAAIILGNSVVWKPAIQCTRTSIELHNSLLEVGLPQGLVNLTFGDASTAQQLISHPGTNAVTLTGSVSTGQQVASACGARLKHLQAELGGNNAAFITEHCKDLPGIAKEVALNAFAYAGQACTATRRLVIPSSIEAEFMELLTQATQALVIGDPADEDTIVGPVISKLHQQYIQNFVASAGQNASIFEASMDEKLSTIGCWLPPRIIQGLEHSSPLVQEETFAPILVVQTAKDIQDAVRLCNDVPNGLVGSIYCDDQNTLRLFRDNLEAGVVRMNLPTRGIHLEAPFGGWKNSGLGPPEHGVWDLEFYTQWKAIYEKRC